MESSINSTNATNITKLFDESHYHDRLADVSLAATYLWFLILLISIPATILPPAIIIHIIRKSEELHTNYSLFLVNLLIGDILITINYCFGAIIIVLYLLNIRVYVSEVAYIIITIPRVAIQYSFVLLAIDRVVGVAFPYRYRNIMKTRVVYALIVSVWILAVALLFLGRIILGSPYLLWPFGNFSPPSGLLGVLFLYAFPQIVSAILIINTNVYLHHIIKKRIWKIT